MLESEIQQKIQIDAPNYGCILMRNNSGALKDKDGRLIRYGLGNVSPKQKIKSSDLIGFTVVTITSDMVGQNVAVFTAIEVKKENWNPAKKLDKREQEQFNFIQWILAHGGLAGFANSLDSLRAILRR